MEQEIIPQYQFCSSNEKIIIKKKKKKSKNIKNKLKDKYFSRLCFLYNFT